jgi:AcrR family transcriptional regulator
VVSAGIAIVEREGPEALGISRVAAALKIRPASMYNHVASGEALAKAVALEGNRRILEVLTEASGGVAGPQDQLGRLIHAFRRWAAGNGGLYAHMARIEPDHADPAAAEVIEGILTLFARPLAAMGVPGDQQVHAMRLIRSALHGFVLLETSRQFQLQETADDSFDWMVKHLIAGVARQSSRLPSGEFARRID